MKRILLTQDEFAIVDDKNYNWLNQWKWCVQWSKHTNSFYARRMSKFKEGKQYPISMVREILGLKRGDKRQADHRNHNTLDNRESNLRVVSSQQNNFNREDVKGYCWNKARKKYMAYIGVNGKQIHLGLFKTAKEAYNAYLKAKRKYHCEDR